MTPESLTTVFAWMTTINIILLICSSIALMGFRKPIMRIHAKITGLEASELTALYFRFLANYKIGILLFNLVPYLALRITAG